MYVPNWKLTPRTQRPIYINEVLSLEANLFIFLSFVARSSKPKN